MFKGRFFNVLHLFASQELTCRRMTEQNAIKTNASPRTRWATDLGDTDITRLPSERSLSGLFSVRTCGFLAIVEAY